VSARTSAARNLWATRNGHIGAERIDGRLFYGGRVQAERKHRAWMRRLANGIGGIR
jgi:hypothetical protein